MLSKRYGYVQSYTAQQVRKTVETAGLNVEFSCFAVAMFSSRESFDQFHRDLGETCDYDLMRAHIADKHFNGFADFTVSDVFAVSAGSAEGIRHGGAHEVLGGSHSSDHNHH